MHDALPKKKHVTHIVKCSVCFNSCQNDFILFILSETMWHLTSCIIYNKLCSKTVQKMNYSLQSQTHEIHFIN